MDIARQKRGSGQGTMRRTKVNGRDRGRRPRDGRHYSHHGPACAVFDPQLECIGAVSVDTRVCAHRQAHTYDAYTARLGY